jgi:hypothetical protein
MLRSLVWPAVHLHSIHLLQQTAIQLALRLGIENSDNAAHNF